MLSFNFLSSLGYQTQVLLYFYGASVVIKCVNIWMDLLFRRSSNCCFLGLYLIYELLWVLCHMDWVIIYEIMWWIFVPCRCWENVGKKMWLNHKKTSTSNIGLVMLIPFLRISRQLYTGVCFPFLYAYGVVVSLCVDLATLREPSIGMSGNIFLDVPFRE